MRLTINNNDLRFLKEILTNSPYSSNRLTINILKQIDDFSLRTVSTKKINATKKVNNSKVDNSIRKITNSVNILRMYNDKINVNTVSLDSGMSYNTVKKYKYLLDVN